MEDQIIETNGFDIWKDLIKLNHWRKFHQN